MEWVTTTAKTLPEAIDLALDNLGVDESEAEIVVLEEPSKGLFGRMRGSARVEARVKPRAIRPKTDRGRGRRSRNGNDSRGRGGRGRGRGGDNRGRDNNRDRDNNRGSGNNSSNRQDNNSGGGRNSGRNGGGRGGKKSGATAKGGAGKGDGRQSKSGKSDQGGSDQSKAADQVMALAADGSGGRDGQSGSGSGAKSSGRRRGKRGNGGSRSGSNSSTSTARAKTNNKSDNKSADRPDKKVIEETPMEEVAEHLRTFLGGLTEAFGLEGGVDIDDSEADVLVATVEGQHGLMVGPKGRTLDAIQELARVSSQRTAPSSIRIRVDVGGYRPQRAAALGEFARKAADKAIDNGSEVSLEPMSPADRKSIHDALSEDGRVETRSVGTEPRRRVIVIPSEDIASSSEEE